MNTYITIILDAVLPEVSNGELFSDNDGGAEDHHEPDSHDTSGRVV